MSKCCPVCNTDISGTHRNRKYCSTSCVEKARYKRTGQRSSKEKRKQWYEERIKNPEYAEKLRKQARERDKYIKQFLAQYKLEKGCQDCGYNKHRTALDFDHVTGDKKFNLAFSKSITQAKAEIKKCEVVCSNCHRIRTYNRIHELKLNNVDIIEEDAE